MALDTDNLLELVRENLTKARTDPSKIVAAHEAFARLDAELCKGADIPDDWCNDPDNEDENPGEEGEELEGEELEPGLGDDEL